MTTATDNRCACGAAITYDWSDAAQTTVPDSDAIRCSECGKDACAQCASTDYDDCCVRCEWENG